MAAGYEPPPRMGQIWVTVTSTASASTGTIYFPLSNSAGTAGLGFDPQVAKLLQSAEELRQSQLAAWSREAILEATKVLRADDIDPTGIVPRRPRREAAESLHERPKFRGRVCAGSSRYRVMRA